MAYDVVIIGCGPVGATLACLLGSRGIRTLILERSAEPYALPRAIHIDHEIVRIFQSAGIEDAILPLLAVPAATAQVGADWQLIREVRVTSFAPHIGWASDYFFYQPDLERALRSCLERFASVEIRTGVDVTGIAEIDGAVRVDFRAADGTAMSETARFAVGCDGARSVVRKTLGIGLDDFGFEERWLVVDAHVDGDVTIPAVPGIPSDIDLQRTLLMVCDPARPLTVIPCRDTLRRWEFMVRPEESDVDIGGAEKVNELLAPWLGEARCEIIRAVVYRFYGLIAHDWRRGAIFLAGDAAHQTPPFNGQGLCHGIRDAANLAWKLGDVLAGAAPERLLDSYQAERSGQVRKLIQAAIEAGRYICTLDPEVARARDVRMRDALGQAPPRYVDIIPAVELALPDDSRTPASGMRFIQPAVVRAGERLLLDRVAGSGWFLVARNDTVLTDQLWLGSAAWRRGGLAMTLGGRDSDGVLAIEDVTGELHAWLDRNDSDFVLVRPDRHVFAAGWAAMLPAAGNAYLGLFDAAIDAL